MSGSHGWHPPSFALSLHCFPTAFTLFSLPHCPDTFHSRFIHLSLHPSTPQVISLSLLCYFASSFFHSLIPPSPWLPAFFFVCCHSPFLLLSPNLSYTILLQLLFLSHIQWCFARPRLALWPRSWRHSVSPYIIDHQTTRAKMHIFIYLFLSNSIILDHRSWLFFLHLRHTVYPHRKQNIPEKSRSTMLF